jgi:acetyl esterase/lipase
MKSFIIVLCVVFAPALLHAQTKAWQPSTGHTQIPIWPGTPPDATLEHTTGPETVSTSTEKVGGKYVLMVNNVSQPTMTVYSPAVTNTGVAMLVFPGGGYQLLAIDLEGTEICDWLNSRGITAILLKYRVPSRDKNNPFWESPLALEDAQRTLSLVRFHADQWGIDPRKIGVIGFSAGGHMVAATSTHFNKRSYQPVDAVDQVSCRPDFAIACYPGHLWSDDEGFRLNPNVPVTTNTPPTFLLQAENDNVDGVNQSLVYYVALKDAKVPVEMHLYAEGGHGFGLRRTKLPITGWPQLAETWLQTIGVTSP